MHQISSLGYYDVQSGTFEGDMAMDCLSLVMKYDNKFYALPAFQRKPLLWAPAQRASFVERLRIGPSPIGAIVIFVTKDDPERKFHILDGLQRISTMWEFYHSPEKYGIDDREIAEKLLHQIIFPVQRRTYLNMTDAYADFLRLQANLHLTAYESLLGKRSLLPQWTWFSGIEENLHRGLENIVSGYGVRQKEDRKNAHNYLRHNLGLFLRLATRSTATEPWNVTGDKSTKSVEERLSKELGSSLTLAHAETILGKLISRANQDFGIINDAWPRAKELCELPSNRTMEITVIRFLHEAGIYADLNGVSKHRFANFAYELLVAGEGRGQIPYREGAGRVTLGLGKLGRLSELVRRTSVNEDIRSPDDKADKSNGDYPIGRGQDRGHILPRSLYGNGETRPEPSSLNRAKGNRSQ